MVPWGWSHEKNEKLKSMGRPTFEDVMDAVASGGVRDVLENPNYPGQKILIVMIGGYAHAVPFRETGSGPFLITVFPSRQHQKRYGGERT